MKAFRLAANRSATWATFDLELVTLELQELKALNFDLSLTAFSVRNPRMLFDRTEEAQDAPAGLDARTITQPGDLWNCCGHRVLCGDSTSAEAVQP